MKNVQIIYLEILQWVMCFKLHSFPPWEKMDPIHLCLYKLNYAIFNN